MDKAYAIQTIRKVDMQLMNYFRKVKAPLEGIRYKDVNILQFIYKSSPEHQITITELATYLKITTAAASQSVSAYEKQGWVKRIRSEQDRRVVYVKVSDTVKDQFEKKMNEYDELIEKFLAYLGEEDAEKFCDIVEKTVSFFEVIEND